jgi:hypothetical protein
MRPILISALALISLSTTALLSQSDAPSPTARQQSSAQRSSAQRSSAQQTAAKKLSGKAKAVVPPVSKEAALVPLTQRERALQMLDRFTFGPRPGDVDRLLALGPDKWFEQQLNPEAIKDPALDRRLADFPTLNMTPQQALLVFPDRGTIQQVADGKKPMPGDPLLAAMYEVQMAKLRRQNVDRKPDGGGNLPPEPSDAEKAAEKQEGQITAARIAGELFALAKNQRMAALIQMPVDDRIAFTSYLGGDQRNLLMADFNPREREIFQAMASNVGASYQIGQELSQAKMVRAILSERQLQEVMTDFWFNHFNIYVGKDSDQWYTTSYERDAIRKNALGKFGDLLLATAQSPAMMVYLDNWLSIGPDSLANGVNPANPRSKPGNKGLNENYGREIMELHTVGVNGGYTQADVTNLAAILTGWTVNQPNQAGPFQFDPKKHEPGTKIWLGHKIGSGQAFVIQGTSAIQAELAARDGRGDGWGADWSADWGRAEGGCAGQRGRQWRHDRGGEGARSAGAQPGDGTLHQLEDCAAVCGGRSSAGAGGSDGEDVSLVRWRHQGGSADHGGESGVRFAQVFSQQGEDADGISRLGVPHHDDRPDEPWRAGEHHQGYGHAAVLRAAAYGVLHHGGQVDELERAGGPAELRVPVDGGQVRESEV